jgi:DNA-binding NtrC family response regulator
MSTSRGTFEQLPLFRRIQEMVRRWWGLDIGLAYADGYVADHARGVVVPPDNPYCRASMTAVEGFRRCNHSIEEAVRAISASLPPRAKALRVETCHLGFPMLMVPIVREGRLLGVLFTGGFVLEDEAAKRRETVTAEARLLGLGVPEGAVWQIPALSRERYLKMCEILELVAEQLLESPGSVQALEREGGPLASGPAERLRFEDIVGRSPVMQRLYQMIDRVAPSQSTVLITGEDGTGKELVAKALYARSGRAGREFITRNCSAFNDNLLESELFGHVKGSFTGADRDRPGVFELAHEGTLFLDEVGDTSPAMQVKLLRVLQDGSFVPVGSSRAQTVDVRIVAATNRPLLQMVKRGTFRKDLYYRLNVINLHLPPLRERPEDVPHLCDHILGRLAERSKGPPKTITRRVAERLASHDWPGNIRELESELERLYVLSGDAEIIDEEFMSPHVGDGPRRRRRTVTGGNKKLADLVRDYEREIIAAELVRTHWNKKRTAEDLGMSRTTLLKKIKELDLKGPEVEPR